MPTLKNANGRGAIICRFVSAKCTREEVTHIFELSILALQEGSNCVFSGILIYTKDQLGGMTSHFDVSEGTVIRKQSICCPTSSNMFGVTTQLFWKLFTKLTKLNLSDIGILGNTFLSDCLGFSNCFPKSCGLIEGIYKLAFSDESHFLMRLE